MPNINLETITIQAIGVGDTEEVAKQNHQKSMKDVSEWLNESGHLLLNKQTTTGSSDDGYVVVSEITTPKKDGDTTGSYQEQYVTE